ncbi:MAG: hypothetical protein LBU36_05130 [Clostridiales bacterium]|jgi:bifunctional N-acetylglucosamine-1-phosphate-uridyltransferase/glucosamine-1-phosphate-acetyltransferase GlmU-like protein|nr:hypothetical protein [Clostridiales bacterium]
MKKFAVILEKEGSQKILGEPASYYIELSAEKAGFKVIKSNDGSCPKSLFKEREEACFVMFIEKMPLIKPKTFKALFRSAKENGRDINQAGIFQLDCEISSVPDDFFAIHSYAPRKELVSSRTCEGYAKCVKILQKRINKKLLKSGVFILDPKTAYIGPRVRIAPGAVIHPNVVIEGETVIGENCVLGPGSKLVDMEIGSGTEIDAARAYSSKIGENCHIGPFAYIRPGCVIGDNVKIGDFVEVKNSSVGNNTKASHLTYIGDSDFGENINIGCGSITVNYDGRRKHRTVVEDGAFIGCNSNLVAPVTVGRGAFVAAGSTLTEDAPEGCLSIARARQVNKSGWKLKDN